MSQPGDIPMERVQLHAVRAESEAHRRRADLAERQLTEALDAMEPARAMEQHMTKEAWLTLDAFLKAHGRAQ